MQALRLLWICMVHWDTDEQSLQLMSNQGQSFSLSLSGYGERRGGGQQGSGLQELALGTPPFHRAASP